MKPEELMKYAGIIEQAKKQQRAKKLELNNVRVLEDKQIAKVNAPIVKALGENKKSPMTWFGLGKAYYYHGDYENSLICLNQANVYDYMQFYKVL